MPVQPNKAIVGANAFAHESGIHQDGMLKHEATYEIMRPESVGRDARRAWCSASTPGRAALSSRLSELGYALRRRGARRVFARFKSLADRRKSVADADLEALVLDEAKPPEELFALEGLQVGCGTQGMPTATVRLRGPNGRLRMHAAVGTGPVHAAYKAIDALVQEPVELLEFSVRAVTEGIDALGEVTVRVRALAERDAASAQHDVTGPPVFHGHGRRRGHHRRQREGVPQGAQPDGHRARPRDPASASTPSRRESAAVLHGDAS